MAKAPARDPFRCSECGWSTTKWVGRCGECQAWGSVEESGPLTPRKISLVPGVVAAPATPIGEISLAAAQSRSSGVAELDRTLGGGLVPGGVLLLAGEPGVGKSTLLLTVAAESARNGLTSLYLTGEESAAQVRLRAERLKAIDPSLWLAAETDLSALISHVDRVKPDLLIIDSIQTIASSALDSAPGSMTQVREVANTAIRIAKERGITVILVGHVTKDGSIAGPRLLEHLVDVVLNFEGDRHSRLRLVRAVKNRFGATDEVGCFDLHDGGITGVADPTGLFTTRHAQPVPGTCLTVALEGRRALVAEIQALVGAEKDRDYGNARRVTSGLDSARCAMTLAVLELRSGVNLAGRDIYVATVGGMKLVEPSVDLALALAVASAAVNLALPSDLIAIGEVGLAGEIRRVNGLQQRAQEAFRLGFKKAILPAGSDVKVSGMDIVEVHRLDQALEKVKLLPNAKK
ncbi:MAG: DNA repair protein RadA [Actinobacteria bacterium]|nr:DNA repair protein RadA [Actinomycetota bacterium]